jgi:hypothetical protein
MVETISTGNKYDRLLSYELKNLWYFPFKLRLQDYLARLEAAVHGAHNVRG